MRQYPVRLDRFNNGWYRPGRSLFTCAAWFFFGLPLLRSSWVPFSSVRCWLLRVFGARVGNGVVIKPGVRVKYPWRLEIGEHAWVGEEVWIDNLEQVTIGAHACVSQGVYFCTGNHDWKDPAFSLIVKPITIEACAWVGARATLCPGVTVGEGAVVAVGGVVTKNVPLYEVHAGNPAVVVRIRQIPQGTPPKPPL
jgi:putative colanic acid biosynthesis acetyltransferase WcaF